MSAPANPQSIQKLLDENAQLIRALVENMNIKGKAMECLQYQQSLHKNLVFLASLADPSLNIQAILPPPGSVRQQQQQGHSGQTPSSTATTASHSAPGGGGGGGGGGVSSQMTTSAMSAQRQPQVTPASSGSAPVPTEVQQSMRQTPPAPGGQYPAGSGKGYGGSPWSGQGQGDPYSMQRSGAMGPMGSGYPPMGMSPEQQLRIRQEQLIQAQQARRMQQSGGGGMYPPPPGTQGHPPPGMMPPQGQPGLPPGYPTGPPTSMNPHAVPPGSRSMKMH